MFTVHHANRQYSQVTLPPWAMFRSNSLPFQPVAVAPSASAPVVSTSSKGKSKKAKSS